MRKGRFILGIAGLSLGLASMPAWAQGSLPGQLAVCARIGKKDARLECYDSIARAASQGTYTSSFGSALIAPTPGAPPLPGSARAVNPPPVPAFGAEQIDRPVAERAREEGESELTMAVASARDNGLGMWTVALTDGAVWRMTERVGDFRPPAPQETVTIRKASLGSYLMQVGRQAAVRVTRVR